MPKSNISRLQMLNDEVIELAIKENSVQFQDFIDQVLAKAISTGKGGKVTRSKIRDAIKNFKVSRRSVLKQTYIMMLLSDITTATQNKSFTKKNDKFLLPITILLMAYPINRPKVLAKKLNLFAQAFISKNKAIIPKRDEKVFRLVSRSFRQNTRFILEQKEIVSKEFTKIEKQVKSNLSKVIFKDMNKEIRTKISEVVTKQGKEVVEKRFQTFAEIRSKLTKKFDDQVKYRVRRIVDTEMHELAERVKLAKHASFGFTHKKWNTEGDRKVRDTHRAINRRVIPITSEFKVGASKGLYPGDPKLAPGERINCRCDLTYVIK